MATAREIILNGPQGKVQSQGGAPFLRRLFNNFCRYARTNWSYCVNSPVRDYPKLLASTSGDHFRMDCSTLAGAFRLMVEEDLGIDHTQVVSVSQSQGFATKAQSKCFDLDVVGNIRTASQGFAAVGRCVFGTHVFVETPTGFYDPCMTTTYREKKEVKSWVLGDAKFVRGVVNPYDNVLFTIEGDTSKLLIRIDPGWKTPPHGFSDSFLLINTQDLNKKDYELAFGKHKPDGLWQMRTKSVSEMLQMIGVHVQFRG